ncbi:MAG: hypothetical protein KAG14_02490 [Mycoplasmataceae bacterium]|nr:hypothetical protein [Mycoplasmataceae bacterium]
MCLNITKSVPNINNIKNQADLLSRSHELKNRYVEDILKESSSSNKGLVGNLLENWFGLENNNRKEADFKAWGIDVELKTTPIKTLKNNTHSSKERLVIGMINFNKIDEPTFSETSSFQKIRQTLIVNYELFNNRKIFRDSYMLAISQEEMQIIEEDYKIIRDKIKSGKAHLLSDSDTTFLSASRKGHKENASKYKYSKIPAKRRAWSLKTTFMTRIVRAHYDNLVAGAIQSSLIIYRNRIINLINTYKGLSVDEIDAKFGRKISKNKSKHRFAINEILKSKKITKDKLAEYNINIKVMKENASGKIQESMSFSQIDFFEYQQFDFEQTEPYNLLNDGVLIIRFTNDWKLSNCEFKTFTDEKINTAREAFELIKASISTDNLYLPKLKDKTVIHVRPKARNSDDKYLLPNGKEIVKQSLWINKSEFN